MIVQISGSWCPNCMDETAYLSEWYRQNKDRGAEIIMLCYERTPDFEKSKKAVQSFIKRFNVTYPVLITGVTPSDPKKAEKTLPQLTALKGFPTTIFLDKSGKVKKVHTGFNGPGTGEHYETFKKRVQPADGRAFTITHIRYFSKRGRSGGRLSFFYAQ